MFADQGPGPRTQSPFLPSSQIISLPSFALTYLVYLEISLIQGYLYSLLKIWIVHFVNGEKYILLLFHFFTLQHAHPVHDHCMLHIISELCISTPPEVILLVADLTISVYGSSCNSYFFLFQYRSFTYSFY